jgi:tetratricopeptide (TPR) repeat protein
LRRAFARVGLGSAWFLSRRNRVRLVVLILLCALLNACAGPRSAPEAPAFLFRDDAFTAPQERFSASDLFALSEPMRRFLKHDIASQLRASGPTNGLIEALYTKNQLKLAYDAATTRNASEAFDARAGNCLSMVIMTAAFAKELSLPVEYNAAGYEEVWSRSGDFLLGSGHVNISVGARDWDVGALQVGRPLTVDFLPPEDVRGLPSRVVPERMIVAMYMNNKSVEALLHGELDDAYGWVREAIRQSPEFASSYNTLGIVYLHRGDPQQAARVFGYALELAPNNTSVMANFADVLSRLGDQAQAAALRQRLARIDPNPPYYFFNLAMAAMQRDDFSSARRLFAKEVARADYNEEFHYWLGVAYFKLGEIERARREVALAMEKSASQGGHNLYAAKLAWLQSLARGTDSVQPVITPKR